MARLSAVLRPRAHTHLILLALIALALPAVAAGKAHSGLKGTPVPKAFVGVDAGGPLFNDNVSLGRQLDQMVASGVQTVRVVFNWSQAQPYQDSADIPSGQQGRYVDQGGIPTDFSTTDQIVGLAAARGLTVLPTILYAPGWDEGQNPQGGLRPPVDAGFYANYLTALIGRYGPHGSFWSNHHPRLAIRMWQIWNEPNLSAFWPQPFAASYVGLVRVAHDEIKRADPGAKVVLGAITNAAWIYLGQIYAIPGAKQLFDMVSVNGFTSTPSREIEFLTLVRRALDAAGDPHKPLLATEFSWPSAAGKPVPQFDWDSTERGQARKIAALLPKLAAHRKSLGLAGFYYYTWVAREDPPGQDNFNFAGLLRYQPNGQIVAKPALAAYRQAALTIEGCVRKGRRATSCVKRA